MNARGLGEVGDLYRRCVRILGNAEMAQDAAQEVFVRVLEHVGSLHDDRAYLPWLYRVSTNYCLDRLRQRIRDSAMAAGLPPESTTPGPECGLAMRQWFDMFLEGIDEQSQQIAIYSFVDGMTQEEIATVMGLSRRTVGKKITRLRENARYLRAAVGP